MVSLRETGMPTRYGVFQSKAKILPITQHPPRGFLMRRYRWNHILTVCILCTLLFCTGLCSCTETQAVNSDAVSPDTDTPVSSYSDKITIKYEICKTGGGTIDGWRSQHGATGETTKMAVTVTPKTGYVFTGWSDGNPEPTRTDVFGTENAVYVANFAFDRQELPIISITTATGRDVTSKDEYMGAVVSMCNTGSVDYELSGVTAEIRGRGNGTWEYPKKSYRLKFERKQNLMGLGTDEHRSWILMANHADRSMLRNYLAIDLANRLEGIGYNNNATHVALYLNGEYRGVYLLAEQIEVDAARVDIGTETLSDPEAEDAGFLVELDEYAEEPNRFYIDGQPFEIKSDILNEKQRRYIIGYIGDVHDAIMAGDKEALDALADLDSFVDGYLLEEFFKNIDAGWSSFYMHKKPGEKMVFGPFWDFDLSSGNNISLDGGAWDGIYVGRKSGMSQEHIWYITITQYEWFTDLVKARWTEIQPHIDDMFAELDRVAASAPEAFERNYEVWKLQDETLWHVTDGTRNLESWQEHADYLCDWLTARRDWLTEYLASDEAYEFRKRSVRWER